MYMNGTATTKCQIHTDRHTPTTAKSVIEHFTPASKYIIYSNGSSPLHTLNTAPSVMQHEHACEARLRLLRDLPKRRRRLLDAPIRRDRDRAEGHQSARQQKPSASCGLVSVLLAHCPPYLRCPLSPTFPIRRPAGVAPAAHGGRTPVRENATTATHLPPPRVLSLRGRVRPARC